MNPFQAPNVGPAGEDFGNRELEVCDMVARPEVYGNVVGCKKSCSDIYNCCDCGGDNCGCIYCWSCNACESCLNNNDW